MKPSLSQWLADRKLTHYERRDAEAAAKIAKEAAESSEFITSLSALQDRGGQDNKGRDLGKDNGPAIVSSYLPAAKLADKKHVHVRTMAGKLSRAEQGAGKVSTHPFQGKDDNRQCVYYDISSAYTNTAAMRRWLEEHGTMQGYVDPAFAALREMSVEKLPWRIKRKVNKARGQA